LKASVYKANPSFVNLIADQFSALIDGKGELVMATRMTVGKTFAGEFDAMSVYLLAIWALDIDLQCSPVKHIDRGTSQYAGRHAVPDGKEKEFDADVWVYPANV
jgi:hypothetical protein